MLKCIIIFNMFILSGFLYQLISEFLPISSTLFLNTLGINQNIHLLHMFSGFLLCMIFFQHFWHIMKHPVKHLSLIYKYSLAVLPSGVVFILLRYKQILPFSIDYQIIFNICAAILLLLLIRKKKDTNNNKISYKDSLYMGIVVSINGFIPGLSRLGTSLTYLLYRNYNLKESYKFSIITSIPILLTQPLLDIYYHNDLFFQILITFLYPSYMTIIIIMLLLMCISICLYNFITYKTLKYILFLRIIYYIFFYFKYILYNNIIFQ
jgi:undecaprenyl pyrophosphate phosphatase UppP